MITRKSRLALAELYAKLFGITDHTLPSWVWADLDNDELFKFLYTNGYPQQFYEAIRKKKYPDEIRKFLLGFLYKTITKSSEPNRMVAVFIDAPYLVVTQSLVSIVVVK